MSGPRWARRSSSSWAGPSGRKRSSHGSICIQRGIELKRHAHTIEDWGLMTMLVLASRAVRQKAQQPRQHLHSDSAVRLPTVRRDGAATGKACSRQLMHVWGSTQSVATCQHQEELQHQSNIEEGKPRLDHSAHASTTQGMSEVAVAVASADTTTHSLFRHERRTTWGGPKSSAYHLKIIDSATLRPSWSTFTSPAVHMNSNYC